MVRVQDNLADETLAGESDYTEVNKHRNLHEKSENTNVIEENFNVFPQKGVNNFSVANFSFSDDVTFNVRRLPTAEEKNVFCDSLRTDLLLPRGDLIL